MATKDLDTLVKQTVTLAGENYIDTTYMNRPVANAYIQCSWFSPEELDFMEQGLKALGENPTISLKYSHHPLSHQYNDINVNEHPEVMNDPVWQQATMRLDIEAMKAQPMGIAFYIPSKPDVGIAWESGFLYASHKTNVVVIPDSETNIPINLMMLGNTQIITLSYAKKTDFTRIIYKPYSGKVF